MKYKTKNRGIIKIVLVIILLGVLAIAFCDFTPSKETKEITIPFTRS